MNLSSETFSETYTYEDNKKILVKLCNLFFQKLEKMLQSTLKLWKIKNLNDYVKYQVNNRQKTVEKTKLLANFYKSCFEEACNELDIKFSFIGDNVYIINSIKYKICFSSSSDFVINTSSDNYILLRAVFNDDDIIEKSCAGILNSTEIKNIFNFSKLKIGIDDNFEILIGDVKEKINYLEIIPTDDTRKFNIATDREIKINEILDLF